MTSHSPNVLFVLQGSLMADIGSGDGKYFGVNPNIYSIGCDRSLKLLQVREDQACALYPVCVRVFLCV